MIAKIAAAISAGVLLTASPLVMAQNNDDVSWLVNLVKANVGHTFCPSASTTLQDVATALHTYSLAHPELHDEFTDPVAKQALAEIYPCRGSHAAQQAPAATAAGGQQQVEVPMQGVYATIDTKPIMEVMHKLQTTVGNENDDLISDVEKHSGNYAPPVFFALANLLFQQGKVDDALFWLNAGRLRADFDAKRCADASARSAVSALVMQMPLPLRRAEFNDVTKLRQIIRKVVQWDESTPYNYEFRWINLSGMDAMQSGLGSANAKQKPLSLPADQWPDLARKNRADYLASLNEAIKTYESHKPAARG